MQAKARKWPEVLGIVVGEKWCPSGLIFLGLRDPMMLIGGWWGVLSTVAV
jgi:hypothetical protein